MPAGSRLEGDFSKWKKQPLSYIQLVNIDRGTALISHLIPRIEACRSRLEAAGHTDEVKDAREASLRMYHAAHGVEETC
jgi:hypothetical protein